LTTLATLQSPQAGQSVLDPRPAEERLIVALDFPSAAEALALVDRLDGTCQWFKVGLELYISAGNSIVTTLKRRGHSVFLDLKLHDIPNTVAGAVRSVSSSGADLLTVHALGGPAMLRAACEAAAAVPGAPRLLAVTILTSMDAAELAAVGISAAPGPAALGLAQLAQEAGITGLVCSPQEVGRMRSGLANPLIVTPGIRPSGAAIGDQKRVATPGSAIADGADYLVVGRPITHSADPAHAAHDILQEIQVQLNIPR